MLAKYRLPQALLGNAEAYIFAQMCYDASKNCKTEVHPDGRHAMAAPALIAYTKALQLQPGSSTLHRYAQVSVPFQALHDSSTNTHSVPRCVTVKEDSTV